MKTNQTDKTPISRVARRAYRTTLCSVLRLLLVAALLSTTLSVLAGAVDVGGKRHVDTMTINLYVGGGTGRVVALNPADPGYLTNLVATVTGVYYEILASQPPVRLQGVADEIATRMPDIVAVEEASLIRTESPGARIVGGTQPATHVVLGYLQILTDALAARGAPSTVVSSAHELH